MSVPTLYRRLVCRCGKRMALHTLPRCRVIKGTTYFHQSPNARHYGEYRVPSLRPNRAKFEQLPKGEVCASATSIDSQELGHADALVMVAMPPSHLSPEQYRRLAEQMERRAQFVSPHGESWLLGSSQTVPETPESAPRWGGRVSAICKRLSPRKAVLRPLKEPGSARLVGSSWKNQPSTQ